VVSQSGIQLGRMYRDGPYSGSNRRFDRRGRSNDSMRRPHALRGQPAAIFGRFAMLVGARISAKPVPCLVGRAGLEHATNGL
jgi:hypothetical protein